MRRSVSAEFASEGALPSHVPRIPNMLLWSALLFVYSAAFVRAESGLAPFLFFCLWILVVANSMFGLRRMPLWLAALVPFSAAFMLLQSASAPIALLAAWALGVALGVLGSRKVTLWTAVVAAYAGAFAGARWNRATVVLLCFSIVVVAILRTRVAPRTLALLCAIAGATLWPAFYFAGIYHRVQLADVLLSVPLGTILGCGLAAAVEIGRLLVNWADTHLPRAAHREPGERRRLQFTLRQLLMAVVLVSLPTALIAAKLEQGRKNRHAAVWLRDQDITVGIRSKSWLEALLDVPMPPTLLDPKRNSVDDNALAELRAHVADVSDLRCLGLANCPVSDAGLQYLKGLTRLEDLELRDTKVTDAGVAHLRALPALKTLGLARTGITDEGMGRLGELSGLEALDITRTRVTDEGLRHLRGLRRLKRLDLTATRITDAGLEHLEGLASLESLILSGTEITDAGLKRLKRFTNLKKLSLNRTRVTDDGLAALREVVALSYLSLSGPAVTDAGLEHLQAIHGLREVYLSDTRVTAAGVAKLRAALPGLSLH